MAFGRSLFLLCLVAPLVAGAACRQTTGSAEAVAAQPQTAKPPVPPVTSAAKQPVVWSGPATPVSTSAGAKASVNVSATIASGWHIYALTQKEGGPTPLELTLPANQPFKMAGSIVSTKPEPTFDAGFGMEVQLLSGRAEFALPVTVSKTTAGKQSMIVEARYQACNANLCLPARTDRLSLPFVIK